MTESKKDDCNCHKTPGTPTKPDKPDRPKPRREDCCEQLIDILRSLPGLEIPKIRKLKQRPARKIQSLCDSLGITDSILPVLAILWNRYQAGETGRNDFENKIRNIFDNLEETHKKSMAIAFAGY